MTDTRADADTRQAPAPPRRTARGEATRRRILDAARALMCSHGVAATSIDQVLEAANAGKSQLYHYFETRDALVAAVVAEEAEGILQSLKARLLDPGGVKGVILWLREAAAASEAAGMRGGCPVGSIAAEVADRDPALRTRLADVFESERELLSRHLAKQLPSSGGVNSGSSPSEADRALDTPDALAIQILAALQGGLLLGKTTRDPQLLRAPVEGIIARLQSLTPPG